MKSESGPSLSLKSFRKLLQAKLPIVAEAIPPLDRSGEVFRPKPFVEAQSSLGAPWRQEHWHGSSTGQICSPHMVYEYRARLPQCCIKRIARVPSLRLNLLDWKDGLRSSQFTTSNPVVNRMSRCLDESSASQQIQKLSRNEY